MIDLSDPANPELKAIPLGELGGTLERVEGSGRSLIDLATWRVLLLMLAFFVLLALYRLLSPLFSGR